MAPTDDYAAIGIGIGIGIGFNGVGPGQVRTGMTKDLFATEQGRTMASDAKPAQYNGIAEAQDIAATTSGNPCGQRTYSNRWNSLRSVSS